MNAQELIARYQAGERDFSEVDLVGAMLEKATVTDAQLAQAESLKRAVIPDGIRHNSVFECIEGTCRA